MDQDTHEETTTATVYRQFADLGDDVSWWIEDRNLTKAPETKTAG